MTYNITEDINQWEQTTLISEYISLLLIILIHVFFLAAAFGAWYKVTCSYKRKEFLLLGFPLILIFSTITGTIAWLLIIKSL